MKKMPLFSRSRSPAEIVRNLKEAINTLEQGGDSKKLEKVRKNNSTDLITYFVVIRNRRKSSTNTGPEDEEALKRRLFRQV